MLVSLMCIYPPVFPLLWAAVFAVIIAASWIRRLLNAGGGEVVGMEGCRTLGPGDQGDLPVHLS